jgi:hypothetical protein
MTPKAIPIFVLAALFATSASAAQHPITDLHVNMGRYNAALMWTDESVPPEGFTVYFEIRRSTSTITEANWSRAEIMTPAPPDYPVAADSGYTDCYIGDVNQCLTYYFAIKTLINTTWSGISNNATGTSYCGGIHSASCDQMLRQLPPQDDAAPDTRLALTCQNPLRGPSPLSYDIPASQAGQRFEIGIFDLSGRRIATPAAGFASPGHHVVEWNLTSDSGGTMAHGVYFARLRVGAMAIRRTLLVMQ